MLSQTSVPHRGRIRLYPSGLVLLTHSVPVGVRVALAHWEVDTLAVAQCGEKDAGTGGTQV